MTDVLKGFATPFLVALKTVTEQRLAKLRQATPNQHVLTKIDALEKRLVAIQTELAYRQKGQVEHGR